MLITGTTILSKSSLDGFETQQGTFTSQKNSSLMKQRSLVCFGQFLGSPPMTGWRQQSCMIGAIMRMKLV